WVGTGDGTTTQSAESGDRHVLARSSLRPSQSPVSWNRAEVMTIFAESEEFAARIVKMYPNNPGDPSRNFVTTMYIGLLDRLADSAGLEHASGLFDAAKAQGGIEACRTQAKQTAREILACDEFQSTSPTNEDYVVRLYRAFLGRFPADHEKSDWTGELAAGRTTTDAMIDQFAAAPEFTARLEQYFRG
ncbi:MAG TPA: DUF4214 domain-containing protein, partial [Sumerlaeia bacterium]|nr:DUF4214 domain-containing protein [Sumerlaeia bacterium]